MNYQLINILGEISIHFVTGDKNTGNANYLAECETPIKNLLEHISNKNKALNASLCLLNWIRNSADLKHFNENDEYVRLNAKFSNTKKYKSVTND